MKHKHFNRLLSMLLVVATLFGLMAVPASAASLGDSGTVTIQQAGVWQLPVQEKRRHHRRRLLEVHQQRRSDRHRLLCQSRAERGIPLQGPDRPAL